MSTSSTSIKMSPGRLSERRGVHKLAHIDPPSPVSLRKKSHEQSRSLDCNTKSFLSSSSSSSSSAASSSTSSTFDFSAVESAFPTPYTDIPPSSASSSMMPVSTPATSVCQDDWVKPMFPASFTMARSSSKQNLAAHHQVSRSFSRSKPRSAFASDGSSKFPRLTPTSSDENLQRQPLRRQKSFPVLAQYHYMPPTPPSRDFSVAGSRSVSPVKARTLSSRGSSSSSNELPPPRTPVEKRSEDLYDPDTLSDPSAPASPAADGSIVSAGTASTASGRTSRRTTVLNKIIPQKLRASMRRRSSASSTSAPAVPPIPPLSTMPSLPQQAPSPKEDLESYFASKLPSSVNNTPTSSSEEQIPRVFTETPELPPLQMPFSPPESSNQSPIAAPPNSAAGSFTAETLVAAPVPVIAEPVYSPLPAPSITPLASPAPTSIAMPNCATVNGVIPLAPAIDFPLPPQVYPDVLDPSSPAVFSPGHRATASVPTAAPITADSLADMIERMCADDHAFAITEKHFRESGWTTEEELLSIQKQRVQSQREWRKRIMESKRALIDIRKAEVSGFNIDTCNNTLRSPPAMSDFKATLTQIII